MIAAFNQLKSQLTRNEKRVLYTAFFVLVACILISFITPVYWQKILDNTHWTVTSGAAAWLTWYAYSKASIQNKPIKYWFFIAYACYFMGDLLWDIQSATKWQTFPSPSDLLYPLLGIGFIIGFLHALKTHLSRAKYIAAKIDLFALVSALLGLVLVLYLPRTGKVDYLQLLILAAYPVSLLSAACLSIFMIAYVKPKLNLAWWCLMIGLSLEGLVWMRWNLGELNRTNTSNALLNFLFSMSNLLISTAILQWSIVKSSHKPFLRDCLKWQARIPAAAFCLASFTILLIWLINQKQPASYYIGLTSIILVMLFSLLRQSVLLKESEKLLSVQLKLNEKENEYQQLKHYDTLTNLPNCSQCERHINEKIMAAEAKKQSFSVFYIDIDRFKLINDSLGNQAGDKLLLNIAQRLGQYFPDDFIARLGGDKFLLVIDQANKPVMGAQSAQAIINTLTTTYQLGQVELTIDASIGISMYPLHAKNTTLLISNAESAMFEAKHFGGSNYQFYTTDITQKAQRHLILDNDLRAAIKKKQFYLDYQPIFVLNDKSELNIRGVEALIRWNNNGVLVPPIEFIAHAEATGFILAIEDWVIDQALKQLAEWNKTLPKQLIMSINLSPRQFFDKKLVTNISVGIDRYKLNPQFIKFEITESAIFDQENLALTILADLKALGVLISLDDFGTGYSSLSQLSKIPLDQIKLDHSFLQELPKNLFNNQVVVSIISMANALNIEIVCEGIETQAQLDFLKNTSCKCYQGFMLSRPVSPEKIAALVFSQA